LHRLGPLLATHPEFPHGTNVELVEVRGPGSVTMLIWERGVGPTESSGTGTCAAAVAAMLHGGVSRRVTVTSPGGSQEVDWTEDAGQLQLTGWAEIVAEVAWWP
jgi:diaminopimelate epimerase